MSTYTHEKLQRNIQHMHSKYTHFCPNSVFKKKGREEGERAHFRKSEEFLHIVLRILKKLCVCQRLIAGDRKEKRVLKNEVKNNFYKCIFNQYYP